jgi:hypothetical protein
MEGNYAASYSLRSFLKPCARCLSQRSIFCRSSDGATKRLAAIKRPCVSEKVLCYRQLSSSTLPLKHTLPVVFRPPGLDNETLPSPKTWRCLLMARKARGDLSPIYQKPLRPKRVFVASVRDTQFVGLTQLSGCSSITSQHKGTLCEVLSRQRFYWPSSSTGAASQERE